ncbi:MAG: acyl-CoA thioesterase FadM [Psychrobacter glaciei]|uniref:thioesterase family protein n=1 Tax=Psychrobacter TaxID=497 RepID=UPI00188AFB04|nr:MULTISPECIES: thioesterase family protein [Psychrobacter]MBF4490392.1 thioesterase [Psychrobacter sp. N25K4-3-2]MBP3946644.1 thioesterase [Psychrobacter sp. K31L]MCH1783695.1 thioesterase family protein [Psychrobacter glaciei]
MSNQELNFDDGIFVFETVMRVRNTEIDMGQHLALQSLTALLTEAMQRFLYSKGIKEINADHQGLIINKLQLSIFSCVRAREELLFEVGVEPLCDNGGNIVFKAMRMHNGEIVAKARQHFVNYDFRLNKITTLDNTIKKALYPHLFEL